MKINKSFLKRVILEETKKVLNEIELTPAAQAVLKRQEEKLNAQNEAAKICQICKGSGVIGDALCGTCKGSGKSAPEILRIEKEEAEKKKAEEERKKQQERQAYIARCTCSECKGAGSITYTRYAPSDYERFGGEEVTEDCKKCRGRGMIC
jgi:DnaJ-class molecular chaperone